MRSIIFLALLLVVACKSGSGTGDIFGRDASLIKPPNSLGTGEYRILEHRNYRLNSSMSLPAPTIDKILQRDGVKSARLSWIDDSQIAVIVQRTGNKGAKKFIIDLEGSKSSTLTDISYMNPQRTFSLELKSNDNAKSNVWQIIRFSDGTRSPVNIPNTNTIHYSAADSTLPQWSHSGEYVALAQFAYKEAGRGRMLPQTIKGVQVIDNIPGGATTSQLNSKIVLIDPKRPEHVQAVEFSGLVRYMEWGKNNHLYVSIIDRFNSISSTAIYRISADTRSFEEVYRTKGAHYELWPRVSRDGKTITAAIDVVHRSFIEFLSLVLIDIETGKEKRVLTDISTPVTRDYVWGPDDKKLFFVKRQGGLDQLHMLDISTGHIEALTNKFYRAFDLSVSPSGKHLLYQSLDPFGIRKIHLFDLISWESRDIHILDNPSDEFTFGEYQHVRWQSTDGLKIYGHLFLPNDFDINKKYPLLVDVHGGGPGSWLFLKAPLTLGTISGPLEWHTWNTEGYIVFVPDYRSTGDYGPKPKTDRRKIGQSSINKDTEDLISGVKSIIAQGYVDRNRIGIIGHSAGGGRVHYALTQTDLFSAAIVNDGIAFDPMIATISSFDTLGFGGKDLSTMIDLYGGKISEFPERYAQTIMFDYYKNKTPTLMLVGNEQMGSVDHLPHRIAFSILATEQIPTRLVEFVDEGHVYRSDASSKLAFNLTKDWLAKHLDHYVKN